MRKRMFFNLLLCGLVLALVPLSTRADQIALSASSQTVTFTGATGGILDVTLGSCVGVTCTLSGNAIGADGEAGTYSLVTTKGTDNPDFGPINGFGIFPLSNTDGTITVFNFTDTVDGDSNVVNASLTYVDVAEASGTPPFVDFQVPALGGPTSGTGEFSVGAITCTGLSGSACNIDNVALTSGATAAGKISGGQVGVSEPATLSLLGFGLLVLGLVVGFGGLRLRKSMSAS